MYEVITIISPLDYGSCYRSALTHYNRDKGRDFSPIEIQILRLLKYAKRGMLQGTMMRKIYGTSASLYFQKCVQALIVSKHISVTQHRTRKYYTITISGRHVLDDLNAILEELASAHLKNPSK